MGFNNESHIESVPRSLMPFQVPKLSSTGNSTKHYPQNCGIDEPTIDTSESTFINEELIIRYLYKKSKSQVARSYPN